MFLVAAKHIYAPSFPAQVSKFATVADTFDFGGILKQLDELSDDQQLSDRLYP